METPKLPQPSEADIKAFQELYLGKFSMKLTYEQAQKVAQQVIGIVYVQKNYPVELEVEEDTQGTVQPTQLSLFSREEIDI